MRAVALALLLSMGCGGGGDDDGDDQPPIEGTWQRLGQDLPAALLAAWSSSLDDVWVVGGREAIGAGPLVYHFDGTAWTKMDTGQLNIDLWQVFGFPNGDVFFGGSNGTILRFRGGSFEKLTTPGTDIAFGLWGSSENDVFAVGGQPTGAPFVWHFTGTQFEEVPGVPTELENAGAVWKVVGRAANDVFMSCSRGTVLHWDGQALSAETIGGTEESLFSLGCYADGCVTAGTNLANGVLYENAGAGWASNVPTLDGPIWRGVTPVSGSDNTYVVGMFGAVIRREGATWVSDPHGLTQKALHAAWSDAAGNLFVVGGEIDQVPPVDGVLLFKGVDILPALP